MDLLQWYVHFNFDIEFKFEKDNYLHKFTFSCLFTFFFQVHFLRPLDSLFEKDEVDSVQCLFWPDMKKHADFARYVCEWLCNLLSIKSTSKLRLSEILCLVTKSQLP